MGSDYGSPVKQRNRRKLMRVAYIKWRDAGSGDETNATPDEINPERILESVGFIVKEDKHYLTIAMDSHLDSGNPVGMFNTTGSITKANIITRREIDLRSARRWKNYNLRGSRGR